MPIIDKGNLLSCSLHHCLPRTILATGRAEQSKRRDVAVSIDGIRQQDQQTRENFETARLTPDLLNKFHIFKSPRRHMGKEIHERYHSLSPSASKPRRWSALFSPSSNAPNSPESGLFKKSSSPLPPECATAAKSLNGRSLPVHRR